MENSEIKANLLTGQRLENKTQSKKRKYYEVESMEMKNKEKRTREHRKS